MNVVLPSRGLSADILPYYRAKARVFKQRGPVPGPLRRQMGEEALQAMMQRSAAWCAPPAAVCLAIVRSSHSIPRPCWRTPASSVAAATAIARGLLSRTIPTPPRPWRWRSPRLCRGPHERDASDERDAGEPVGPRCWRHERNAGELGARTRRAPSLCRTRVNVLEETWLPTRPDAAQRSARHNSELRAGSPGGSRLARAGRRRDRHGCRSSKSDPRQRQRNFATPM